MGTGKRTLEVREAAHAELKSKLDKVLDSMPGYRKVIEATSSSFIKDFPTTPEIKAFATAWQLMLEALQTLPHSEERELLDEKITLMVFYFTEELLKRERRLANMSIEHE